MQHRVDQRRMPVRRRLQVDKGAMRNKRPRNFDNAGLRGLV
jgi:hypothetical protein